ncbi:MAG TPA: hypothetical protein VFJ16_23700 [Longimicrobium sp.]|nr:hypothetical protein [Longimicrobium sp.]
MHPMRRFPWVCLAVAACGRAHPASEAILPKAFQAVADVRPGTSLAELQRSRPHAEFAPYVGYQEKVGRLTFRYVVEGTESRQFRNAAREHVDAVEVVATHPAPEAARAAWAAAFREYEEARQPTKPVCYVIDGTMANNGPAAVWETGHGYVLLRAASGRSGGTRVRPASPLLIWRVGEGPLPPPLTGTVGKSEDCAAIAGRRPV